VRSITRPPCQWLHPLCTCQDLADRREIVVVVIIIVGIGPSIPGSMTPIGSFHDRAQKPWPSCLASFQSAGPIVSSELPTNTLFRILCNHDRGNSATIARLRTAPGDASQSVRLPLWANISLRRPHPPPCASQVSHTKPGVSDLTLAHCQLSIAVIYPSVHFYCYTTFRY
jgi:hypothetical protein